MNCNTTRSHPLYFYSRPCGRGDWIFRPSSVSLSEISTHAPAGGATLRLHLAGAEGAISTHAPAGGATRGCGCCCASCRNFYSRPCGRGDEVMEGTTLTEPLISTHAPAGGAT